MTNAKPILNGKFWILEDKGVRIGTLTLDQNQYMFSSKNETKFFDSEKSLKKTLGDITWNNKNRVFDEIIYEVYGYPTSYKPYNPMYNVKKKIPLFTKSPKSKSVYCAGYYIIKFNVNWLKSFCPKLVTLENNNYQGPFRTELEAKQALSKANAKK